MLRAIGMVVVGSQILGCDMRGDDPKVAGAGRTVPGAERLTLFACETRTCFSGTQFCLKTLSRTGQVAGAECVEIPERCDERRCFEDHALKHSTAANACRNMMEFHQDDARVTVVCRAR